MSVNAHCALNHSETISASGELRTSTGCQEVIESGRCFTYYRRIRMMQTSCRISSGSEHSITSYAPQSQLFVDCFKFACKVSLLCGPTKSVILHYHLNLKIDSELHGHNRLRIKPFRVFLNGRVWAGWAQPDGRRPSWWVGTRSSISPRHTWEFNVTVALCLTQHL